MGDKSAIQWTDATWNVLRGCSRVSEGCRNCYAERVAIRQAGSGGSEYSAPGAYHGLVKSTPQGPRWTGEVRFVEEALTLPLKWRQPRRIFVNSMSDLFHERVTNEQIAAIFGVMAQAKRHTFQVLTKRPARMVEWFRWAESPNTGSAITPHRKIALHAWLVGKTTVADAPAWPLPNVHLGVSVEDQATSDARIRLLLQTPAAVRWVSAEPLLGPIQFCEWLPATPEAFKLNGYRMARGALANAGLPHLDWLVIGGESGPGARPFDLAWARSAIAQCEAAGVPVFLKQLGSRPVVSRSCAACDERGSVRLSGEERCRVCFETGTVTDGVVLRDRKGGAMDEWPVDLRVREFPLERAAR